MSIELQILDLVSQGVRGLDQITEALKEEGKPSRTTVFRRISELVEAGWLIEIPADLGGGVALGPRAYNLYLRELQSRRAEAVKAAARLNELIADELAAWREAGAKGPVTEIALAPDPGYSCQGCADADKECDGTPCGSPKEVSDGD